MLTEGGRVRVLQTGAYGTVVDYRNGDEHCEVEVGIAEGAMASRLRSMVFAMHADRWTEPFAPRQRVLDGYSWTMSVYADACYFVCEGNNAAPAELLLLLRALSEAGLPVAWKG